MSDDGYVDSRVQGGVLKCECGRMFHVSLFRQVLKEIARRAYTLGRHTEESAVDEAIEAGYQRGREIEANYARAAQVASALGAMGTGLS